MRRAVPIPVLVLAALTACDSPAGPDDLRPAADAPAVVLDEPTFHVSDKRGENAPYAGETLTPGSYWLRVDTDERDWHGRGPLWKHARGVDSVVIVVDGERTREIRRPYEVKVNHWEVGEHAVEWSVYGAIDASKSLSIQVTEDGNDPPSGDPSSEDLPSEDPPSEDPPSEDPPSNGVPTASFSADCTELTCSLDASASSDPDGSVVSYSWNLGDGTTAGGESIEHEYDSDGTFDVRLTVTDDDGATDSATEQVTVEAPAPPPPSGEPQPDGPSGSWELALADEFDGSSLDGGTWTPHYAWWPTDINNELQFFDPDRPTVSGGTLKLTADRTAQQGKQYTSGAVSSHGKFSFRFGVAEMRARLPAGKGLWPAFWTMPEGGGWPPEIDIMENIGDPGRVHFNLHFQGSNMGAPSFSGLDTRQWHTYTVHWRSDRIDWYVDGVLRASYTNAGNIPQQSMYLLLNLAVGGSWPGSPDGSTPFPATYEIDYVRVWQ